MHKDLCAYWLRSLLQIGVSKVRWGCAGIVAIHTKLAWVLSSTTSSVAATAIICLVTHTLRVDFLAQKSHTLDENVLGIGTLQNLQQ